VHSPAYVIDRASTDFCGFGLVVAVATLGMGGWLDLTQKRLSPCAKICLAH
jgi:hypothetical protein